MLTVVSSQAREPGSGDRETSKPFDLKETERKEASLVSQLRAEANDANENFSRLAFRALTGSGVALAAIIEFMFFAPFDHHLFNSFDKTEPLLGFLALPVLTILLLTIRMGTYAYTLSNRHFAYQLYLARVCHVPEQFRGRWRNEYRDIGWEEAMRAWRIVQNSLFLAICKKPGLLLPHRYKRQFKPKARNPMWFSQETLFGISSDTSWYRDTNLTFLQTMLIIAATMALIILAITPLSLQAVDPITQPSIIKSMLENETQRRVLLIVAFGGAFVSLIALLITIINEGARRTFLADGLLSIHASAITWQAVILAHFRAIGRARNAGITSWQLAEWTRQLSWRQRRDLRSGKVQFEELIPSFRNGSPQGSSVDGAGLSGYTFWLGQEAESLARCAIDVPGWIGLGESELKRLGKLV